MGVLLLAPRLGAPSELWLERMIESLEPHLSMIAIPQAKTSAWRDRIPVVSIQKTKPPPPTLRQRIAQRLGWPVTLPVGKTPEEVLQDAVDDPQVTKIFAHYLTRALEYSEIWQKSDKPLFVHCHGYDVTWDLRYHRDPSMRTHPLDYLDRVRALSERAILIANSECTAQRLRDVGIEESRFVVKYLGVPVPQRLPTHPSKRNQDLNILYLGRLRDCKGPDQVIRAFELACQRGLDGRLVMAGDGELRATCELLRVRSPYRDRIQLLGAVDAETGERLRQEADIFTAHNCLGPLTRQEEAFGVSLVEAMAAGLPVVTGRSGSTPEIIDDGKTGLLFEPGDVERHAEILLQLAHSPDLRRSLGEAAWQEARSRFSVETERQLLEEILSMQTSPGLF